MKINKKVIFLILLVVVIELSGRGILTSLFRLLN